MQRITLNSIQIRVDSLNEMMGKNKDPYSKDKDGKMTANIGNYHISQAYGGVCLHQMSNEAGGVRCPLMNSHVPKRELFEQLNAFIAGIAQGSK